MDNKLKFVGRLLVAAGMLGFLFTFGVLPPGWRTFYVAGGSLFTLAGIAAIAVARNRKDRAPDFLRRMFRERFDAGGLAFAFETESRDGVGWLQIYFQNRYNAPCTTRIALGTRRSFSVSAKQREWASAHFYCGPGAFGCAHIPIAVPRKLQGKKRVLDLWAGTQFSQGRREILRYACGRVVETNSGLKSVLSALLIIPSLLFGPWLAILFADRDAPRRVRIRYPKDVAENLDSTIAPEIEILWVPGDADPHEQEVQDQPAPLMAA